MSDINNPRAAAWGGRRGQARGPRGRNRVRRGDVQAAILALLAEQDMHGYQILQELAERSGGAWRPSSGSIYPTLRQLQDQGLIRSHSSGSRRVFSVTELGRRSVRESGAAEPWRALVEAEGGVVNLRRAAESLLSAIAQVESAGTDRQLERATAVIGEARRSLYLLLAGEDA
jgi:DNA-binding PadR family transcriptional regulator